MSVPRLPGCRSCGASQLDLIMNLGRMPLANALLTAEQLAEREETYPLELVFCRQCSLVQITETVPPEKLFRNYFYFSSSSDTLLRHAQELAERLVAGRQLDGKSLVVEIASNDGYLLQYYKHAGIPVLGIEPARNVARVAWEKHNVPSLTEFFNTAVASRLRIETEGADVVHVHNVLAHVADLNDFVAGTRLLLKDTGIAVIEVAYVKSMIERLEFDMIYHEHLCYFSLTSLVSLFERHGMVVTEAEHLPIHGGTLRICVRPGNKATAGVASEESDSSLQRLLQDESRQGIKTLQFFLNFESLVQQLGSRLRKLLSELKANGKRIAAYGASAKGTILLNYLGIDGTIIDYVVDRCEPKHGFYTPGTHLPIHSPQKLIEEMPDYVLLLAWTYFDEILEQQKEYRLRGGSFIIPIPSLRIV